MYSTYSLFDLLKVEPRVRLYFSFTLRCQNSKTSHEAEIIAHHTPIKVAICLST